MGTTRLEVEMMPINEDAEMKRALETMRLLYRDKGFELNDDELKQLVLSHNRKVILVRAGVVLVLALVLIGLFVYRFL